MSEAIKSAFAKIKEDILNLQSQILSIKNTLEEIKRTLQQTDRQINPTDTSDRQTNRHVQEALKLQNLAFSTRNEGVQTDRQTDQQTDRKEQKFVLSKSSEAKKDQIDAVAEVLGSLDKLKRDLRFKFKKLTAQEMLVFSTLYHLTDQGLIVDYSLLSSKTNLSESSIRDYVQKIIRKGVPLSKTKENNKKVILSIPQDFKRIASLQTINSLRKL